MLKQLFDLTGRTAVVTGGSKGIGKAIARGLAEAGARVVICSRRESEIRAAAAEVEAELPTPVIPLVADLTDRAAVDTFAAEVLNRVGTVDILVNNAGNNRPQVLEATTFDVWDEILQLNFTTCMQLAKAFAPGMQQRQWGRIVHLSSVMALASGAGRGLYSATKSALIGMARAHALELGPHGITVNCLAPGPIATDLPMNLLNAEQKQRFADRTALKRWGEAIDMVGPALLLCSPAGAYISGHVLLADGGMLCRTFD
jgi:NAD(P)-dependent dehydrogenase (short-subunit alcohol dehydrogenase family)